MQGHTHMAARRPFKKSFRTVVLRSISPALHLGSTAGSRFHQAFLCADVRFRQPDGLGAQAGFSPWSMGNRAPIAAVINLGGTLAKRQLLVFTIFFQTTWAEHHCSTAWGSF